MDWKENILHGGEEIAAMLKEVKRIAVIGIKMEENQPAYYVPNYLKSAGFTVIPVPVYYPDATEILGETVYRNLTDIHGEIDLVNIFRRSADVPKHLDDILEKRPKAVWMQSGIRNDDVAESLAKEGIKVVQNLCLMVEHRALAR
ncbi:MAG: CoA-binding protein [Pyrinomonadaceae bacterium]|nr:CoA-binding protein [Pyrinomonadaceae bacterium]